MLPREVLDHLPILAILHEDDSAVLEERDQFHPVQRPEVIEQLEVIRAGVEADHAAVPTNSQRRRGSRAQELRGVRGKDELHSLGFA